MSRTSRTTTIPPARIGNRRGGWLIASILAASLLATAGTLRAQTPTPAIEGRVMNGTTGRPVPKVPVQYVLMSQGMSPVATSVTNAEGRFRFDKPASGNEPALLRVEHQGATYSRLILPKESAKLEVQVFDATRLRGTITVNEHAIFLHPSGNTLAVIEQIVVANESKPPKTYVNPEGTFPFTLAATPRETVRATVTGPGGMPLSQEPKPGGKKNSFVITYPIRPGETEVRLEYAVDYRSPYQFSRLLDLSTKQVHVVTPGKQVQLTGDGLTPLKEDPKTGFVGYKIEPRGNVVRLQVAGEVPESAGTVAQDDSSEQETSLATISDPVTDARWIILSVAGLIMLAGLIYHYRRE